MSNYTEFSVTSTAEGALRRLKKHKIAVYNCKKRGADFIFGVKDKDAKKVFAIFAKACYNVRVEKKSAKSRLLSALLMRAGLVAGVLVFTALAALSNFYCLKLEVGGSGGYLRETVLEIVREEGGGVGKPFSKIDGPLIEGRVLAIPEVVFCHVSKRGSALIVDVEVGKDPPPVADRRALVSDADGKVVKIVAICGTAAVSEGDEVSRGEKLILPYEQAGDSQIPCLAVGVVALECKKQATYLAPDDSERSIREAYSSALAEGDEILSRSHTARKTEDGTLIIMEFTFLHKLSINYN